VLAITFAARRHNVNVLLRNSTFLIFAVLMCNGGRVAVKHCFKLFSFLHLYLLLYYNLLTVLNSYLV